MIRICEQLTKENKKKVLNFLNNRGVVIKTCADGSRINLDKLTKELLEDLGKLVDLLAATEGILALSL